MTDEYTPSTAEVEEQYIRHTFLPEGKTDRVEALAEFRRWLAAHDAEVSRAAKAEALEEFRSEMKNPTSTGLMGVPRSTRKEDEQPVTTPEAPPHMVQENGTTENTPALEEDDDPDLGMVDPEWDELSSDDEMWADYQREVARGVHD